VALLKNDAVKFQINHLIFLSPKRLRMRRSSPMAKRFFRAFV